MTRVRASFNGVSKAMEYTNLKWQATWNQTEDWDEDYEDSHYEDDTSHPFEILIDLYKDSTRLIE